ncbi:transmembrane protein 50A [Dermatophagoides pteronyssinus]|uniref:Transmembrane protein 50A-like n=1 Tax=Dermatophagoides pteronyssinus TaxID=6956 RepID=A0A6P6Y0M0_DERPT|nr:transmembrane protein 50A-like [Dermatophagoides pteronyssinus]
MSSCFENCIGRLQDDENRNKITSIVAGSFFAIGWWIIIDISSRYYYPDFNNAYHVCGVLATISLLMINSVSSSRIEMYSYGGGDYTVHIWLFIGFVLGFGSLIASLWILFGAYVVTGVNILPGLGIFFQNLFIFLGSIIFKFGRRYDEF